MPKRGPLELAFARARRSAALLPADAAVVELGRQYAEAIDADPANLAILGPNLLDVLGDLGFTPKARAAMFTSAVPRIAPASPLVELRARRERTQVAGQS